MLSGVDSAYDVRAPPPAPVPGNDEAVRQALRGHRGGDAVRQRGPVVQVGGHRGLSAGAGDHEGVEVEAELKKKESKRCAHFALQKNILSRYCLTDYLAHTVPARANLGGATSSSCSWSHFAAVNRRVKVGAVFVRRLPASDGNCSKIK